MKDSLLTSKKVNIFFSFIFSPSFFFLIQLWGRKIWLFKEFFFLQKQNVLKCICKEPLWEEISVLYRTASWDYLEWTSWETSRNSFPPKTDGGFSFNCFKSCRELKREVLLRGKGSFGGHFVCFGLYLRGLECSKKLKKLRVLQRNVTLYKTEGQGAQFALCFYNQFCL